jgi:hypothetical protein
MTFLKGLSNSLLLPPVMGQSNKPSFCEFQAQNLEIWNKMKADLYKLNISQAQHHRNLRNER